MTCPSGQTVQRLGAGWLAVNAVPGQSFPFTVPGLHVGAAVAATALLGVAASVLPARRAARIDLLHAINTS